MRRSDTLDIIHAANYGALCIAILRSDPTSVEDAFSLYETGNPQTGNGRRVNHVERIHEMAAMKDAGMSWKDIGMVLGLKAPECYFVRHKHLLGGGDRMKYRNPRNNHTFQIERRPRLWLIVERGWDGKIFCIIDKYDREEAVVAAKKMLAVLKEGEDDEDD